MFAERATRRKLPGKNITKRVACISKRKDYMFRDVEVIYFRDMFNFLLNNIQRRGQLDQYVRYASEWLVRALDIVGVFSGRGKAYEIYKYPAKTHAVSASESFRKPKE